MDVLIEGEVLFLPGSIPPDLEKRLLETGCAVFHQYQQGDIVITLVITPQKQYKIKSQLFALGFSLLTSAGEQRTFIGTRDCYRWPLIRSRRKVCLRKIAQGITFWFTGQSSPEIILVIGKVGEKIGIAYQRYSWDQFLYVELDYDELIGLRGDTLKTMVDRYLSTLLGIHEIPSSLEEIKIIIKGTVVSLKTMEQLLEIFPECRI